MSITVAVADLSVIAVVPVCVLTLVAGTVVKVNVLEWFACVAVQEEELIVVVVVVVIATVALVVVDVAVDVGVLVIAVLIAI
jgi:hypothetical protein